MIKNLADKYRDNKNIFNLFFIIPLFLNAVANYSTNEDIWYMMKYGKYILHHGFPHIDFLSMHQNLHIVVQQGFSNVIYYILYQIGGSFSIFILLQLMIIIYLYLIYKICMLLSNNEFLSTVLSIITVTLLQHLFIIPRSQVFTYLFVIGLLYILESFYKNNKSKLILLLPLISVLQINLHAALWYILFIVMIPYIIQMCIDKNKEVFKLIVIIPIMILVGFINPYTYENVFFPFRNYDPIMADYIGELLPITLKISFSNTFAMFFLFILSIIILIYIYYKKGKLEIRHLLLLGGTTAMALINSRSTAFFLICSIPMLANYLKNIDYDFNKNNEKSNKLIVILAIITLAIPIFQKNKLVSEVNKEANYIKNHYGTNVTLYTTFNEGSYCEYIGLHPYIDTRAEVFLEKSNKKEDIFREFIGIYYGYSDPKEFINKYKFTHFIIEKKSYLYYYLKSNKNYHAKYSTKKYTVFVSKKL